MQFIMNLIGKTLIVLGFGLASVAFADGVPSPVGAVILTIKGQMTQATPLEEARFDLESLQKIGVVTFTTTTPWTEGAQQFTGVPLNKLLIHIGATASRLRVTAINEYQVEVPASDAVDGGPILAWAQNDNLLSVREKGPLWLMYPFDTKEEYRTEEVHSIAVWQVEQIELLP